MKETKVFYSFLLILVGVFVLVYYSRYIFPIMRHDEYFVDGNGEIHNKDCPYKSVPWFTKKASKYDFIKQKGQVCCNECFSRYDEEKMDALHQFNVEDRISFLRANGAPQEYIDNELSHYAID